MRRATRSLLRLALMALVGGACLFIGERALLTTSDGLMTRAEAIIGRPATPLSYAGVARRTTRRAVGAGAVAAPVVVVPPPGVVAPARTCVQATDAYGRIYTRCY